MLDQKPTGVFLQNKMTNLSTGLPKQQITSWIIWSLNPEQPVSDAFLTQTQSLHIYLHSKHHAENNSSFPWSLGKSHLLRGPLPEAFAFNSSNFLCSSFCFSLKARSSYWDICQQKYIKLKVPNDNQIPSKQVPFLRWKEDRIDFWWAAVSTNTTVQSSKYEWLWLLMAPTLVMGTATSLNPWYNYASPSTVLSIFPNHTF